MSKQLIIKPINNEVDKKIFTDYLFDNYPDICNAYHSIDKNELIINFKVNQTVSLKNSIKEFYNKIDTKEQAKLESQIEEAKIWEQLGKDFFKYAKKNYFKVELLSPTQLDYVYTKVSTIALRLNNGDWELALYYMSYKLLENGQVSSKDIQNGYTQDLHNAIIMDMQREYVKIKQTLS